MVPLPFILKQWSISMVNFLSVATLLGISNSFSKIVFRSLQYFYTFYLAEYGIMVTFSPNLVLLNTFFNAIILVASCFSYKLSTLFNTMINLCINISAIIMHSAVWVCIPLFISTTKNMRSIIWAPPMIVRIKDAWPGQSTKVNWKYFYFTLVSSSSGTRVIKDEKPKSNVIPLSWDWGLLSKLAVEATCVKTLQIEVLPESTCPSTPTLIFMQSFGLMAANYSFSISNSYLSICPYLELL